MQTKRRIADFVAGVSPALFIIILPTFVVGLLLDPPYDVIGLAAILVMAAFFTPWSPWPVLSNGRARRARFRLRSRTAR
jgi:hypothetical protein